MICGLFMAMSSSFAALDNLPDAQRLSRQGQWSQALAKVDAHLASQPNEAQGRFLRGVILAEMGRSADAIVVFSKLVADYPELPEPYNNLAVLYAQQKHYDEARTALEMAIRTHPSYSTAHENLGDVYAKLASQAYDKALKLDSSNQATQSKLSMIRELISTSSGAAGKPGAAIQATGEAGTKAADQPAKVALAAPPVVAAPIPASPVTAPASRSAAQPAAPAAVDKMEQAVVAAAPAQPEPPKLPPTADAADEAEVSKELQGWASAWSRKDVKAYLGHYAADFDTPRGMSRKAWEAQRHQRIDKPGKLQVDLEDVQISFADDKATVKFRQHYVSATLKSTVGKTLLFVKMKGRWLIQQERVS